MAGGCGGGDMSDSSSGSCKKKGWPRGRRRNVKVKDVNAPKMPMSGYMLFLNDHRERVRAANPGATFSDMTRLLANAWQAAAPDDKQRYMEAAQLERQRYNRQLHEYQQTDAYRQFSEQMKAKAATSSGSPPPPHPPPPPAPAAAAPMTAVAAAVSSPAATSAAGAVNKKQQHSLPVKSEEQSAALAKLPPLSGKSAANRSDMTAESVSSSCFANEIKQEVGVGEASVGYTVGSSSTKQQQQQQLVGADCDAGQSSFDVPIFTDQFLAYNRQRDDQLRQLRRTIAEHEERNAALQRHLDGVQEAVERLESEAGAQRGQNAALQQHLAQLRQQLAESFGQLQLPPEFQLPPPNAQNIDEFLSRLVAFLAVPSLEGTPATSSGSPPPPACSPLRRQQYASLAEAVRSLVLSIDVQ